ncbi:MAG: hypothetical protein ACXVQV_05775 [Actinomycetota bacterium]
MPSRSEPPSRKKNARKPAARKPATRKPAARATPARSRSRSDAERSRVTLTSAAEEEEQSLARPVAVESTAPLGEMSTDTLDAAGVGPEPRAPVAPRAAVRPAVVDRPGVELGIGVVALLLAVSVFLPWYHNGVSTVNGWTSGSWGPVIFFLALLSVAIVALRRARMPVAFPIEATLIIEAGGWVSVIGLILKRYFAPRAFGFTLPTDGWLFASLGLSLALAVLGGMASSNASFVVRPGWFRGRAGVLGAAIVVLALAGGVTFGFVNTSVQPVARSSPTPQRVDGMPRCGTRLHLPAPSSFTPTIGFDFKGQPNNCTATLTTTLAIGPATSSYVAALRSAGWTVQESSTSSLYRVLTVKRGACGSIALVALPKRPVSVTATLYPCAPTVK